MLDDIKLADMAEDLLAAKERLAKAKRDEAKLRAAFVKEFGHEELDKALTRELEGRFKVTVTNKVNRTYDEALIDDFLRDHVECVGRLVTYVPKVSVTELKKLPEDVANEFAACVTVKPGTPEVKILPIENEED